MSALFKQTRLILRNDLRLLWRDFRASKFKIASSKTLLIALIVLLNAVSILAIAVLKPAPSLSLEAGLWAFFVFLMLGASMNHAIALFFERADFDLLLPSPISTRAILLARLAAMSVSAFIGVALFLVPLLNGAIAGISVKYFAGYGVWAMLAIIAASLGIWLTLAMVRVLGARRARIWVQIFAAVLGASIYLAFQLQNHLSSAGRFAFWGKLQSVAAVSGFTHVARAARGDIPDLLMLAVIAAFVAVVTARQLARTFLTGIQESSVKISRPLRPDRKTYRLSGGLFRATFFKDLRLILRDPLLLSQTLPSFMYIIPAFFGMRNLGGLTLLSPIAVVVAVQFSSLLSDAAAAGEECLDLIRASPSAETRLRLAKMAAGMALPVAASLALCLVIAGFGRPWQALLTFFTAVITASGCSWLSVTRVSPTPRKDLLSRQRRRTSIGRNILIGMLLIAASGGISLIAHGSLWFIGVALLGATYLGVIACFTFVSIEEIDTSKIPQSWTPRDATTS